MTRLPIEKNYQDALFFASATINEKKDFYITDGQYRLLTKLIHYSKKEPSFTWSSENISKHVFNTPDAIDKVIQRLKRKGYITVKTEAKGQMTKKRTISINWFQFEKLNQLIEDYQNAEPIATDEQIIEHENPGISEPEPIEIPAPSIETQTDIDTFIIRCKSKFGRYATNEKFDALGKEIKEYGFVFIEDIPQDERMFFLSEFETQNSDGDYYKLPLFGEAI